MGLQCKTRGILVSEYRSFLTDLFVQHHLHFLVHRRQEASTEQEELRAEGKEGADNLHLRGYDGRGCRIQMDNFLHRPIGI